MVNDMLSLRSAMDRLLDDAVVGSPSRNIWERNGNGAVQIMPLNLYTTDDQAVIQAAVPGIDPDQLELTIHQNTVTLGGRTSGEVQSEEAKGATWYLREIPAGQFRRSVTLPFEINTEQAQASFEHGILRVVLPKAEQAKPRRIQIIGGQQPQAIGGGTGAETPSEQQRTQQKHKK